MRANVSIEIINEDQREKDATIQFESPDLVDILTKIVKLWEKAGGIKTTTIPEEVAEIPEEAPSTQEIYPHISESDAKMMKSLEKAKEFRQKKGVRTDLSFLECEYLARVGRGDIWEGVTSSYDMGFKRGYTRAKRKGERV